MRRCVRDAEGGEEGGGEGERMVCEEEGKVADAERGGGEGERADKGGEGLRIPPRVVTTLSRAFCAGIISI